MQCRLLSPRGDLRLPIATALARAASTERRTSKVLAALSRDSGMGLLRRSTTKVGQLRDWLNAEGPAVAQAAVMFLVAGAASIVHDALPSPMERRFTALVLDSTLILLGIVILCLPWERWSAWSRLALPTIAFAELSINRAGWGAT